MSDMLETRLRAGVAELGLTLPAQTLAQLLRYLAGLGKWNQAYNLTAVREPEQMVVKHLLDSLSILPFVGEGALIDVGTGGGLPGMVLAIVKPELAVTLLDSNGKKTRFLKQMAAELGLKQVSVVQARVESHVGLYQQVTSRAFASLADMVNWCGHLLAPGGHFLAMKGQRPDAEIAALGAEWAVAAITPVRVPFLAEERHVLRIGRSAQ